MRLYAVVHSLVELAETKARMRQSSVCGEETVKDNWGLCPLMRVVKETLSAEVIFNLSPERCKGPIYNKGGVKNIPGQVVTCAKARR